MGEEFVEIEVGGLVDDSSVSLCIHGAELIPEEVSRLLGVEPTRAHRRGERRGPRSPPSREGAWILEVRGGAPVGPEDHVRTLLGMLPESPAVWARLTEPFHCRLFFGIYMSGWNRGFVLPIDVLDMVVKRGLELDFDLYAHGEDAEDGEDVEDGEEWKT